MDELCSYNIHACVTYAPEVMLPTHTFLTLAQVMFELEMIQILCT